MINRDPSIYINERFAEVKTRVNLRREDLKITVDKHADELIQLVESKRLNCLELAKTNFQIRERIENAKKHLDKLVKQLASFEVTNTAVSKYEASANDLEHKFTQMLVEFKKSLVQKDYLFVFFDHPMEDVFGTIIDNIKVFYILF